MGLSIPAYYRPVITDLSHDLNKQIDTWHLTAMLAKYWATNSLGWLGAKTLISTESDFCIE
jgi:hypothetical protein